MAIKPLEIIPQQENGLVKSFELHINEKTIITPNFAIRPSSKIDFDEFYNVKSKYRLPFTSSLVIRYTDADKLIKANLNKSKQTTLFGTSIKQDFINSINKDIILVDPSMEYLYYKGVEKFSSIDNLPNLIDEYVNSCSLLKNDEYFNKYKNEKYGEFLSEIDKNKLKRFNMIRELFKAQLEFKADILIPPTPIIDSKRTFNLSHTINKTSKEVAKTFDSDIECATYYLLKSNILKNEEIVNDIIRNIEKDNSKVFVLKFKYVNLNTENTHREREIYSNVMKDLSYISKESNKIFILLEGGNQIFPSAVLGFDIVSSSYNGDVDYRRSRSDDNRNPWGYWYSPEHMIYMNRETVLRISHNNGNTLPCYCPICSSIKNPEFLSIDEWNSHRRIHYIHSRHEEMREIHEAIPKGESLIGVKDKLQRSQLKYLGDLF